MKIVTEEGQLKIGDKITIIGKSTSDDQKTTVKDVIEVNGREEIIINKKPIEAYNEYFIALLFTINLSYITRLSREKHQ